MKTKGNLPKKLHTTSGNLIIREAVKEDPQELAKVLRNDDINEIVYRYGMPATIVLPIMYKNHHPGEMYTILVNGKIQGMFGIQTASLNLGVPWLLGSDKLTDISPRLFVKTSKVWLAQLSMKFGVLENYILAENKIHIRWIESLGFVLTEYYENYGVMKKPFWKFRKVINPMRIDLISPHLKKKTPLVNMGSLAAEGEKPL
ncbi:MAG: hypothetical protein JKY88_07840 [Pseudomonadales bacterium]|nr:hypothetical protein [Pseudomonadales bacterium]